MEDDCEEHAFSNLMLDTSLRQLGATIERTLAGHRTDVSVTLLVDETKE